MNSTTMSFKPQNVCYCVTVISCHPGSQCTVPCCSSSPAAPTHGFSLSGCHCCVLLAKIEQGTIPAESLVLQFGSQAVRGAWSPRVGPWQLLCGELVSLTSVHPTAQWEHGACHARAVSAQTPWCVHTGGLAYHRAAAASQEPVWGCQVPAEQQVTHAPVAMLLLNHVPSLQLCAAWLILSACVPPARAAMLYNGEGSVNWRRSLSPWRTDNLLFSSCVLLPRV